jgi:hypothetical protein
MVKRLQAFFRMPCATLSTISRANQPQQIWGSDEEREQICAGLSFVRERLPPRWNEKTRRSLALRLLRKSEFSMDPSTDRSRESEVSTWIWVERDQETDEETKEHDSNEDGVAWSGRDLRRRHRSKSAATEKLGMKKTKQKNKFFPHEWMSCEWLIGWIRVVISEA